MFLILIKSSYRKQVDSFALHVHFICVGLNRQGKTKKTPSGI